MADRTMNQSESMAAASEKSFSETPKSISKGTIIMLMATILFIVIASILIGIFLNAPTGNEIQNSANTSESRVNP
jgi:hypothetical protein